MQGVYDEDGYFGHENSSKHTTPPLQHGHAPALSSHGQLSAHYLCAGMYPNTQASFAAGQRCLPSPPATDACLGGCCSSRTNTNEYACAHARPLPTRVQDEDDDDEGESDSDSDSFHISMPPNRQNNSSGNNRSSRQRGGGEEGLPELVTGSEGDSDADDSDGDSDRLSDMDDDPDGVAGTGGVPGLTPGVCVGGGG